MTAVNQLNKHISLNKSLLLIGVSKSKWYYSKSPRRIQTDPAVTDVVQKIGKQRPTYGTRRMASQVSRELNKPVNRKQIRRIFHKLGWIEPKKTKNDIIKSARTLFKPDAPNQLWQTDITYVWCGVDRWCYCFNVIDAFSRKWIWHSFDVAAPKSTAIDSIINAVATAKPDCTKLILRTDNGSQYNSRDFRQAVILLGIRHEFIWAPHARTKRTCRIIPQDTQEGILVEVRVCKLSGSRSCSRESTNRLQWFQDSFSVRIPYS